MVAERRRELRELLLDLREALLIGAREPDAAQLRLEDLLVEDALARRRERLALGALLQRHERLVEGLALRERERGRDHHRLRLLVHLAQLRGVPHTLEVRDEAPRALQGLHEVRDGLDGPRPRRELARLRALLEGDLARLEVREQRVHRGHDHVGRDGGERRQTTGASEGDEGVHGPGSANFPHARHGDARTATTPLEGPRSRLR